MRFLVISPYFSPHIGGSQRYMEELYAQIVKRDPTTKVDVLCYNTDDAPPRESYRGMTVYRVPCWEVLPGQYAIANPLALIGLLFQLSGNTYDVVHANTRFFESTLWAWAFAKIVGAKSVLTDHVAGHPIHPNKLVTRIAKLLDLTVIRTLLRLYDVVTATNETTLTFLVNTLKCPNAVVSYGGVDTKLYAKGRGAKTKTVPYVRRRFTHRDIIITFAGRLIRTKGVLLYLRAIQSMIHNLPHRIYFVIAGGGPLEKQILTSLSTKRMKRRIFTTGALTSREMRQLLRSSDIFVHPSYHAEGFPNAILEAAASECFVIATRNGGTKEIIRHNVTGLLIKQKDAHAIKRALWWALTNPRKRNTMAAASRQWTVSQFDWKKQTEGFLSIVQTLYLAPHALERAIKMVE